MFYDTGSTYMLHTEAEGYAVPFPGRYRVTMDAQTLPGGYAGGANALPGRQTGNSGIPR